MSLNCGQQRAYYSSSGRNMNMESNVKMILTEENRRTRKKPCPIAILSTAKPTWTEPDANPGLRDEKPGTNRLSHGSAKRFRT
jgi:hypothetical protein